MIVPQLFHSPASRSETVALLDERIQILPEDILNFAGAATFFRVVLRLKLAAVGVLYLLAKLQRIVKDVEVASGVGLPSVLLLWSLGARSDGDELFDRSAVLYSLLLVRYEIVELDFFGPLVPILFA